MGERKSLVQSLQTAELPQEAFRIIQEGSVKSIAARGKVEVHRDDLDQTEPTEKISLSAKQARPGVSNESRRALNRGLVGISARVSEELAETLMRVSFERRLEQRPPFTQREILVQALNQWLKRNGYAKDES